MKRPLEMPDEELLYDLADLFKVFADTTRITILYAPMGRELSVGDLAEVIGALRKVPASHQLAPQKQAHPGNSSAMGKNVIYSFSDDHVYTMHRSGHDLYLRMFTITSISERNKPCVRRLNSTNSIARTAERKWEAAIKKIDGVVDAKRNARDAEARRRGRGRALRRNHGRGTAFRKIEPDCEIALNPKQGDCRE